MRRSSQRAPVQRAERKYWRLRPKPTEYTITGLPAPSSATSMTQERPSSS